MKHSDAFEQLLLEDKLNGFPTELKYFQNLIKNGIVIQAPLLSQHIEKMSHLNESQYDLSLQKLLRNENKAIDTEYNITGIEDEESVVYIENISPDTLNLTSYQICDRNLQGIDSLLFSGEITLLGGFDENGLKTATNPNFYGVLDNNKFVRLSNGYRHSMAQNMVNACVAFIEQLGLHNSMNNEKSESIIRLN